MKRGRGVGGKLLLFTVGTAMILVALLRVILGFVGETAVADVSTRRVGGALEGSPPQSRYEWSVDYSFTAGDGKTYNGTDTRRGSDYGVKVGKKVRYLKAMPQINALADATGPGLGQLIMSGLGAFLIWVSFMKQPQEEF